MDNNKYNNSLVDMKIPLSIIVISFNTCEMTLECLRSIFKETSSINFEVIVLDNASSDGSSVAINNEFGDKIRLISSSENLGFAEGNNNAIKYAKGDKLLLLNPDTIVLNEAINTLFEFSQDEPDSGIWGGKTVFANGTLNPASCWSEQNLWSLLSQVLGFTSLFRRSTLFNPEGIGGWNREGVRQVDIVSGCFFLIKHSLWDKLGGFRDLFFMYGEEADLCLRAREYGAKPIVTSEATIVHYGGASEKVRVDMMVRLLKAKYLLILLHFPKYTKWLGSRLLFLWPASRYIAHTILSIFGHKASSESKKVWGDVFNRSNEWVTTINELKK